MPALQAVLDHLDAGFDAAQARLMEWLRIPSVSAQPVHAPDCVRAAEWACTHLQGMGFTASVLPTAGHPCVVAHHPGPAGAAGPHILYYGHYDVQPAEPLELWTSPPFEPRHADSPHGGKLVARGAVDDKGQSSMWLEALRAWHAVAGGPPVPVTVLLEGEEEIGSVNLEPFLREHAATLDADLAVISDTGMWNVDTPGVTTSLRGMVYAQVTLHAAARDLHSGSFGGSALNPINALTRILGELHDADGQVQLPGFYDGVREPTNAQVVAWENLGFDEAAFLGRIGLTTPVGERGRPALARLWARPTADINGIWGGYQGPGAKTVIAAEAGAKVSFRLVPGQDPQAIYAAFQHFCTERAPTDAKLAFESFASAPAMEVPSDSPAVQAARTALSDEYGRPAVLMGAGGSIPVVESMKRILGLDALLIGFGLDDDQVHSPNEKFELRCFRQGMRSHARLLAALAA